MRFHCHHSFTALSKAGFIDYHDVQHDLPDLTCDVRHRWLLYCATSYARFGLWCSTLPTMLCNMLCPVWPDLPPACTKHYTPALIHDQRQGPGQLALAWWLVTCMMARWPILVYTHHVAKSYPITWRRVNPTQYVRNNDWVGDEYSYISYCRIPCSSQLCCETIKEMICYRTMQRRLNQ